MRRSRKVRYVLQNARQAKCDQKICEIYTRMRKIFQFSDQKICAASTFYEAQKEVLPVVWAEVHKTVQKARELENENSVLELSTDSRWSSRRNGSQNTFTAISSKTGKVIGYKHTVKYGGKREGNCSGPSNMMESNGSRALARELHEAFPDKDEIVRMTSI